MEETPVKETVQDMKDLAAQMATARSRLRAEEDTLRLLHSYSLEIGGRLKQLADIVHDGNLDVIDVTEVAASIERTLERARATWATTPWSTQQST